MDRGIGSLSTFLYSGSTWGSAGIGSVKKSCHRVSTAPKFTSVLFTVSYFPFIMLGNSKVFEKNNRPILVNLSSAEQKEKWSHV